MKKTVALFLITTLLVSWLPVFSAAKIVDSGTCGENTTWTLDENGTLTISGTGKIIDNAFSSGHFYPDISIKNVIIVNGIQGIGDSAFQDLSQLKSIIIPQSVKSIGAKAFSYTGIENITIPEEVTSIEENTFLRCKNLETVNISDNVTVIGTTAFSECSCLKKIVLPDSVTRIKESAFSDCSSLTEVIISDSVRQIDSYAFWGCSGLTEINIPDSVTQVGAGAFGECSGLTTISIPKGISVINSSTFVDCTGLKSVTIPENVTYVDYGAFDGCSNITELIIGNTINVNDSFLLGGVLNQFKSIKTLKILDGVTSISTTAIGNCKNLTKIDIPDSVINVCDEFAEIPWYDNQPNGIVYVGKIAFKYKGSIPENKEIEIKEGTIILRSSLFSEAKLDTNGTHDVKIKLPESLTTIENSAFSECSWLKEITIPSSVTSIGENAFDKDLNIYTYCTKNSAAHKYAETQGIAYGLIDGTKEENTISGTAGKINWSIDRLDRILTVNCTGVMPDFDSVDAPWLSYKNYITTVVLSNGLTSIGNEAFENCNNLTKIDIPNGVTSIGSFAFYTCPSLKKIDLPKSVVEVAYGAFSNCTGLTEFIVRNPACKIGNQYSLSYATVCYGYPNSTLQIFADANGFLFKELEIEKSTLGNLDGDDEITAADARIALRAAVGLEILSEELQAAADVDHDGSITAGDARLILRAAVGLETLA